MELLEDSNVNGVSYSVSGGQSNNGKTYDVSLTGGGVSNTIRFTITGSSSVGGSVQFEVRITAVNNPPNTPLPVATIGNPSALTQGLMLTFQAAENPETCRCPTTPINLQVFGSEWLTIKNINNFVEYFPTNKQRKRICFQMLKQPKSNTPFDTEAEVLNYAKAIA